nr:hypothetical protein [Tanacetum cinerariifolium]
ESKLKEQETPKKPQVKYFEQNRQSNNRPKGNQRNWNNLKSYQLGQEFVLHKKPCFNCGDFSHLAKDCRRRVQRETNRSQNHSYNSSTLRSSGPRPHRNSMRPPFRPAGHRPHGPSMNPRRPTMNGARPYKTFFQTPSFETRPFLKCGDFSHLAKDCRRRVQRETNRSQNLSYKSSMHKSAGHRPNGAHMRPPLRSSGPRPHRNYMRPPFRPAGHRLHGPSINPRKPTMNVNNSYRAPWVPTVNRAVPRTTLMTKDIRTVAALGT